MTALPRAILFDLDDTIISAYSRPDAAWLVVVDEFADRLAPLPPLAVMEAVMTESRISWEDPAWQQRWRMRLNEARRGIVIGAFRRLAAAGHAIPSDEVAVALADRYSAYRQEQMHLFPGAHAVIDGWKQRGVKLALVTNGAAEVQRAKIARFDLAHRFHHIQIEGEHDHGKPDERRLPPRAGAARRRAGRRLDGGRQLRMGSRRPAGARHVRHLVRPVRCRRPRERDRPADAHHQEAGRAGGVTSSPRVRSRFSISSVFAPPIGERACAPPATPVDTKSADGMGVSPATRTT